MTRLSIVLVIGIAASVASASAQTPAPQPLSLASAVARAVEANPAIQAARLQRPVDRASIAVAGERPNPDVTYEAAKETPKQSVGFSLPIELGGKRGSRIDLAKATAAVNDADLDRLIADTRTEVRRAYFDLVAARQRVTLLEDVRTLAERANAAASARLSAGDVPASDVTQARLSLALIESDLIGARGDVAATAVAVNTLLGQPSATAWMPSDSLTDGVVMREEDAVALATSASAELHVFDRQIAEQEMRRSLARAMTKPDVTVGSALTFDAEPEFDYGWRVGGGVTLPIFTRHKAAVVVEDATLTRLRAERLAASIRIAGTVSEAVIRAAAARNQLDQYQSSIVPLTVDAERQAQTAYSSGQTGLPALVQALQIAADARQRGLQAGLDYQHALADLERAVGAPLK